MAEHLAELYSLFRNQTDDQVLSAATTEIYAIYENPESILLLLQLIDQSRDAFVRHEAAIGLTST
jgi:HEAT repeat protein